MKKILITMLDTGGGHRATAEALREAFLERHGQWLQAEVADLWAQHTPSPLHDLSSAYRTLVDDLPWLYRFVYEAGQRPEIVHLLIETASRVLRPLVSQSLRRHNPDLIVSVHPLVQGVVLRVVSRRRQAIPFVTVVSDLVTIPPVWFEPAVTLCFVPSDEGYQQALRAGLRPDQLRQFGLPIRPAFARSRPPVAELRRARGMVTDVPAVLIVSGGEGMGPVDEIARAVAERLAADSAATGRPAGQLVVVCGRNRELCDELQAHDWPVPALVTGFVDDIWDWMAACDCIITKAGPGTIAEALALGVPILLSGYIPGQETGNVPYVLKHGVGAYVEDPWQIAEVISGWFGPQRAILDGIARHARSLGHPGATYQIVEEIARLLEGTATPQEGVRST
jgi:1,2-diacylglycerol 3-beta-galactosyltransferase